MRDAEVFLYFTPSSGDYAPARVLLDDADLRGQYDPLGRCVGGLAIEGPGGPIFVDDDFEHVEAVLLNAAPEALEKGESVRFEYRYEDGEVLEIAVSGEAATFANSDGDAVTLPVADAVADLRRARDELAKLREIAA